MTDHAEGVTPDPLQEFRDHVQGEVRSVMARYCSMKMDGAGAASALIQRLAKKVGAPVDIADRRTWKLTIDVIVASVDRDFRPKYGVSVCAVYCQRELFGTTWREVADRNHRSIETTKEIVNAAMARLYSEFIGRGISVDIHGLDSAAA